MSVNVALICAAFAWLATELDYSVWAGIGFGAGLYFVALLIALSPVGEFVLRIQTGCKKN